MRVDSPHTSDVSGRDMVQNDRETPSSRVVGSEQQVRSWGGLVDQVGLPDSVALNLSEEQVTSGFLTASLHDLAHSSDKWLEPTALATQDLYAAAAVESSDTGTLSRVVSRSLPSYDAVPSTWLGRYRHLRTARINRLLRSLRAIIVSKASQSGLAIYRPVIDVEADPEEGTSQIVLRVYADASPAQTLAFWDSLDIEMDRWLTRLDHNDVQAMLQDIGLRFHWSASPRVRSGERQ